MDVVIFCGGRGTRLAEKTGVIPKPLVLIGEKPILWHIMKGYEHYGHNRFILTLGYKGEMIKEYFLKYPWLHSSFEIKLSNPVSPKCEEDWSILLKDTGEKSTTGKRLNLVKEDIKTEPFLLTYGDGLSDVNINKVIDCHKKMREEKGIVATTTIIKPKIKYGVVSEKAGLATGFDQKPDFSGWINTGFMVLEKAAFDYFEDDKMEYDTLKRIAADGKLGIYKHDGFFASMDTYKDFVDLNELWKGKRPWKVW